MPARETISASCMWNLALRTVWGMFSRLSMRLSNSEDSTLGGADENRLAAPVGGLDFVDGGGEFFAAGLVDPVVLVEAGNGTVRRDDGDIKSVNVMKLVGLGLGRAGHAGKLLVKAEVVLNGDCGHRLGLAVDLDALLGLDGLMKPVAPAAARPFCAR